MIFAILFERSDLHDCLFQDFLLGGANKIKRAKKFILKCKIINFYPSKCFSNQFLTQILKTLRKY